MLLVLVGRVRVFTHQVGDPDLKVRGQLGQQIDRWIAAAARLKVPNVGLRGADRIGYVAAPVGLAAVSLRIPR